MNWNHVWELFKINLLYANPQAVTNLQKRQEKKKKANFSIVNAMLRLSKHSINDGEIGFFLFLLTFL